MKSKTLYIKNMVCDRCIRVVKEDLEAIGIAALEISLGKVVLQNPLTANQRKRVEQILQKSGFELLIDQDKRVVEEIKRILIDRVYQVEESDSFSNLSDQLAAQMGTNYSSLSKLFSTLEGVTIEKFFILLRIERVKELLDYNEKNLSEIAYELEYSSVAYLSNQFKKVTGMTPSEYKKRSDIRRSGLDHLNPSE